MTMPNHPSDNDICRLLAGRKPEEVIRQLIMEKEAMKRAAAKECARMEAMTVALGQALNLAITKTSGGVH